MLLTAAGILFGIYINSKFFAELLAQNMFVHSPVPGDYELPPTAAPAAYSGENLQILGGKGFGLSCSIPSFAEKLIFDTRTTIIWDIDRDAHGRPVRQPTQVDLRDWPSISAWRQEFWPGQERMVVLDRDTVATEMRQACSFHDFCYRHGAATYGYSQSDCDHILLEHAYRLCKYTDGSTQQEECVITARKVVLGVRLGGRKSFKSAIASPVGDALGKNIPGSLLPFDAETASTFFEFDPYPVHSSDYTIYRIANAPPGFDRDRVYELAVYGFSSHHNTTQLRIEALAKPGSSAQTFNTPKCVIELPSQFAAIPAPPMIVRQHLNAGETRDWFAWWMRRDMNQTGGHLAIIDPSNASIEDWDLLFPGARVLPGQNSDCLQPRKLPSKSVHSSTGSVNSGKFMPTSEVDETGLQEQPAAGLTVSAEPAPPRFSFKLEIGWKNSDDPLFVQMASDNGNRRGSKLNFFALRPESCTKYPVNTLCYIDVAVDPDNLPQTGATIKQLHEPRSIKDSYAYNAPDANGTRLQDEKLIYRNFSAPPDVMWHNGQKVFLSFRRGTRDNVDFQNHLIIRRSVNDGSGSMSQGMVKLMDLTEEFEPVLIAGQSSRSPTVISIARANDKKHPNIKLLGWELPKLRNVFESDQSGHSWEETDAVPCFKYVRDQSKRNCTAIPVAAPSTSGNFCELEGMDNSWLMRPPVLFNVPAAEDPKRKGYSRLVFQRLLTRVDRKGKLNNLDNPPYSRIHLQFRIVDFHGLGRCTLHKASKPRELDLEVPRNPGEPNTKWGFRHPSRFLNMVRSTPALIVDLGNDRKLDAVLPFGGNDYYTLDGGAKKLLPKTMVFSDIAASGE